MSEDEIVERLRRIHTQPNYPTFPHTEPVNPDGPEAADLIVGLQEKVRELSEARPWQPWERNYSGGRVGVTEQQGEHENWMVLHVESGIGKTTTSLRFNEAWDLAQRLSPPLVARMEYLFKEMRKAQNALHQFTWADTIAPLLRKVADDWDCDSAQCEFASDDMGGLSCPLMERDGCRAVEAEDLRQFADALGVAEAMRATLTQDRS